MCPLYNKINLNLILEHCKGCDSGTYQNQNASGSCMPCPAGHFTGTGMTACDVCQPEEYSLSDGTGCVACADAIECPCMTWDKCFNGTGCYNTGSGSYQCLPCPDGYEADGTSCKDIDEVYHYIPIF